MQVVAAHQKAGASGTTRLHRVVCKTSERPEELDRLVADGTVRSYTYENGELVVYSRDPNLTLTARPSTAATAALGRVGQMKSKVYQLLIPPELDRNCAPEYLKFRGWCLAGAVCGGAVGFMNARVNLDAIQVAFKSNENAVLAGVFNGYLSKVTTMGASFLAQKGDMDPRKWFLVSSLIATGNAVALLGTLSSYPGAYIAMNAAVAITGALAGTLGSAAGVNLFNHMAKGPNKGLVAAKNANQDQIADLLGMPLAYGMSHVAASLGISPYLFTVGILGPGLMFCNLAAASSIRFESLDRQSLQKLVDHYLDQREVPQAPPGGLMRTLRSLWQTEGTDYSRRVRFVRTVDEVAGSDPERLFNLYGNDKYLLNLTQGSSGPEVAVLFKKDADADDAVRAYVQARLVERGLDGPLMGELQQMYGDQAGARLVEFSYRSVPRDVGFQKEMFDRGWVTNLGKLGIPQSDQNWTGEGPHPEWVELDTYLAQVKSPERKALEELLGPGNAPVAGQPGPPTATA